MLGCGQRLHFIFKLVRSLCMLVKGSVKCLFDTVISTFPSGPVRLHRHVGQRREEAGQFPAAQATPGTLPPQQQSPVSDYSVLL